jgi:hypothetical protein
MTNAIAPRFTHDCDTCTFLGHYRGHDLYAHEAGAEATLIARSGADDAYLSAPREFAWAYIRSNPSHPIAVAWARSIK